MIDRPMRRRTGPPDSALVEFAADVGAPGTAGTRALARGRLRLSGSGLASPREQVVENRQDQQRQHAGDQDPAGRGDCKRRLKSAAPGGMPMVGRKVQRPGRPAGWPTKHRDAGKNASWHTLPDVSTRAPREARRLPIRGPVARENSAPAPLETPASEPFRTAIAVDCSSLAEALDPAFTHNWAG
jgi:hypothetical protein